MEVPPDLELAIAAKIDAERQLALAQKYVFNANRMVETEANKAGVRSGTDLLFMINQMRHSVSAKQVHNLTNPE